MKRAKVSQALFAKVAANKSQVRRPTEHHTLTLDGHHNKIKANDHNMNRISWYQTIL